MLHRNKFVYVLLSLMILCSTAIFPSVKTAAAQEETALSESSLEGQLTLEALQALNNDQAQVFSHDGRVTLVSGTCTEEPVKSPEDAEKVVDSMIELLGGDAKTHFEPWRTFTDGEGNRYYVFQQMYANTTVLGGAVKVITDSEGNMLGLSSSIETELPEVEESEGITAEEAEQIVLQHAEETNQPELTLLPETTAKMILPVTIHLDVEAEETEGGRFVWVVYTDNPAIRLSNNTDLPYLAHYVTMDGEYLYSLATIRPGDTAGEAGFDAAYVFEFMEPVDYTGYVDLSDGSEMELTVTVMRDKRTGMYYLGNIERKIVVGDCYEFLYNGGRVVLASSPDNLEWDQVGLLSFYNYCKAYDYYKEIGWIGGDGQGTPILILNDMCDGNRNRINNAAYMGDYMGWSLFGASLANDFSQSLDVIAHEFTHCVTGTVMTYNSYMNDYGAINEAISDIQGQICDMMYGNEADTDWLIADKSATPVRSMSDPNLFGQPEFSWDLYYSPAVNKPTTANDAGGVHSNSSLLNIIAYRLVTDGGMSLEEARAFWFAVDCAMVPGTDYVQLRELMPFMLKILGMEKYQTTLERAMDAVRLGNYSMPDFYDDDRALVTLTLPDNENFTDDNWVMQIFSVDVNRLMLKGSMIISQLISGDYSAFPQEVQDLLNEKDEEPVQEVPDEEMPGFWEIVLSASLEAISEMMTEDTDAEAETEKALEQAQEDEIIDEEVSILVTWLRDEFKDVYYYGMGSAGQDGTTIHMVTRPGRTIPVLIHMAFNGISDEPDQVIFMIYINDKWYTLNIPDFSLNPDKEDHSFEPETDAETPAFVQDIIDNVIANLGEIKSLDDVLDLFTFNIIGGEVNEISSNGLETVVLPEPAEISEDAEAAVLPEPGKKSRPKLD